MVNKKNLITVLTCAIASIMPNSIVAQSNTLPEGLCNVTAAQVTNPDFNDNLNGWTWTGNGSYSKISTAAKGNGAIVVNQNHWQIWQGTGQAKQTLTNLPNGDYYLTCTIVASGNAIGENDYIFAGDSKVNITKNEYYYCVKTTINNGSLTIGANKATNGLCIDMDNFKLYSNNPTSVIKNNAFENSSGNTTPTGWTLNTQVWTSKTSDKEKGNGTISGNPNKHWQIWNNKATKGKAYQTVSGLPKGIYTISVTLVADYNGGIVKLYGNNNSKDVKTGKYGKYTVDAVVGEEGTLELGLNFATGNGDTAFEIDDFSLTYKNSLEEGYNGEVNINELDTKLQESIENVDVTINRTLSSSYWNSFAVPFSIEKPNGWSVMEVESCEGNVINFKEATSIVAGKPYLVKPNEDVVNPTFKNVSISTTEGIIEGNGNYKFAAQLCNTDLATDGTIAYLSKDGNLKKLTNAKGLKGMRAYFIMPANTFVKLFINGEATAIESITNTLGFADKGNIYNLKGQRINKPSHGIMVKNGKKILVK